MTTASSAAVSKPPVTLMKRLRFQVIRLIRALGLLRLADAMRFQTHRFAVASKNRDFSRRHPGFVPPPASLAYDAYNHANWEVYWKQGLGHATFFAKVFRDHLPDRSQWDVLEWGCGPARIIRHLRSAAEGRIRVLAGSDYNPETVAWCSAHIPEVKFHVNGLMPPLPLPDASFDVVYNHSVFTHLSEDAQLAWAEELHRVLRPGGILVCTTHGEGYRHLLSSDAERARFAAGEVIEQAGYSEGKKWFFAIHPERFVTGKLLRRFSAVIPVRDGPAFGVDQDVWVARK